MKKKVLIFSTTYHPFVGGAEVAVKEITDRMGADFEFDLITAKIDGKLSNIEQIGKVRVFRVGFGFKILDKFLLAPLGLWKALKLDKENSYSITWSIMASQASVPAGWFRKLNKKVKLVLTLQEGDNEDYLKRYALGNDFLYKFLIRPWYLVVFKNADIVQVISNHLKKRAEESNFKKEIIVVPNGVDVKFFSQEYSKVELDDLKSKIGKKETDKFIITTSRLVKKNAVDDVIKSLKFLPANFKFLILGDGPDKEMLETLVKTERAESRVIFAGTIGKEDLPKYLKISDVFIRPSLSEGFGNSFVEAMVADLPVVATQEGGIADFLFDRKRNPDKNPTGWAVNTRDPKEIAEAVKEIFAHPDQTKQTMENAKKMVEEKYDWEIVAERMKKEVFDKIS